MIQTTCGRWMGALLLAGLSLWAAGHAQDEAPTRPADMVPWKVTITIAGKASGRFEGNESVMAHETTWQGNVTLLVNAYPRAVAGPNIDLSTSPERKNFKIVSAGGTVKTIGSWTIPDGTVTKGELSGPMVADQIHVFFSYLKRDDEYEMDLTIPYLQSGTRTWAGFGPQTITNDRADFRASFKSGKSGPVPGVSLDAHFTRQGDRFVADYHETRDDKSGEPTSHLDMVVHASFEPDRPQDMDLIIQPNGYRDWLPHGNGVNEQLPANGIKVDATLKTKSGKPVPNDRKAKRIVFELSDVSRVPGICMNYPTVRPRSDPDLQFDPAQNTTLTVSPAGTVQSARTADGQYTEASALVSAYDWGAYGSIRVVAELVNGALVVGHLENQPAVELVPLPRRTGTSRIGDAWKEQMGVTGLQDDDDSESDPVGDGTKGDGFTLYEEYRGFLENGAHIFGTPRKKDFFIADFINGRSKNGIALFRAATGLAVHHRILDREMSSSNSMNFNFDPAAHLLDQHGVILTAVLGGGAAHAVGGPGLPGQIEEIQITDSFNPQQWNSVRLGLAQITSDYYGATIAHELMHSINTFHHGEDDIGLVQWTMIVGIFDDKQKVVESRLDRLAFADGKIVRVPDTQQTITVKRENGTIVPPRQFSKEPVVLWVGSRGQQHSGVEDCLLRYDVANAYVSKDDPLVRYWSGAEMSGLGLCRTKTDPGGVNGRDHQPQSRYGDATRGDCLHQFRVRDAK